MLKDLLVRFIRNDFPRNAVYTAVFIVLFFLVIRPIRVEIVQQLILPAVTELNLKNDSIEITGTARTGFTVYLVQEAAESGNHVNPSVYRHLFTLLPNVYYAFGSIILLFVFGAVRPVLYLTLFQLAVSIVTVSCLFASFMYSESWIHVMSFFQQYVSVGGIMVFFVLVYQKHSGSSFGLKTDEQQEI